MAPPDQGSGASPPAAAALRRQTSCTGTSSISSDGPVATQKLERRLSCSFASFSSTPAASPAPSSSSSSTTYHPAACSAKSSCESIPFADAELDKHPSISSTSSYTSGASFRLDDCSHNYLDFEPPPSTRPPSVQAMATAADESSCAAAPTYDPKRLSSSMFRTKSTNPAEWSVVSNESLFSIRLSNSGDLGDLYFNAAGFPRFPSMGSSDTSSVMMMRMPSVSEGGLCLRDDCARCSGAVRKSVRFAATAETVSGGGSAAVCRLPNAQESAAKTQETTAAGWCQFGCCWPSLPTLWWPRCCAWHCRCCDCRC